MNLTILKQQLRKGLRAKLKLLSDEVISDQSFRLYEKVKTLECFRKAKTVSIYLNMPTMELQTINLVKEIFLQGKSCYIPKTYPNEMLMVKIENYEELNKLPKNKWDIPEPENIENMKNALDTKEGLDLILLPGLGFDKNCLRIGHGKGYYDKFLTSHFTKFKRYPTLVGIGLDEQVCESIPVDEYDVPLDMILTPSFTFIREGS